MSDLETLHEEGAPPSDSTPLLPSESGGKVGFGIDQPTALIQLIAAALIIIVTGFVVASTVYSKSAALGTVFLFGMPLAGALILAVAASLYWSSRLGKPREVDRLTGELPWGGEEVAVDVGCGRGLMMLSAASRFTDGLAVGVDEWKARDLSGNKPESVWANARQAGVLNNVALVRADARSLPFWNESVDVGMSSMTIHLVGGRSDQQAALRELTRIIKPGGRLAVLDSGRGGEYASILRDEGIVDIHVSRMRFRSFPPLHSVTGRKPFSE